MLVIICTLIATKEVPIISEAQGSVVRYHGDSDWLWRAGVEQVSFKTGDKTMSEFKRKRSHVAYLLPRHLRHRPVRAFRRT
jgi:hypothetical protein